MASDQEVAKARQRVEEKRANVRAERAAAAKAASAATNDVTLRQLAAEEAQLDAELGIDASAPVVLPKTEAPKPVAGLGEKE